MFNDRNNETIKAPDERVLEDRVRVIKDALKIADAFLLQETATKIKIVSLIPEEIDLAA